MRLQELLSVGFVALLLSSFATAIPSAAQSLETRPAQAMWVDPAFTDSLFIGDPFIVDIYVNVTDPDGPGPCVGLYSYEFKLYYERDKLNCTGAVDHLPYPDWNLPNHASVGPGVEQEFNATHGRYWRGIAAMPVQQPYPTPFVGVTSLCTLTFEVFHQLSNTTFIGDLTLMDVLGGADGPLIDFAVYSGQYRIHPSPAHDVAVVAVTPYKTIVSDPCPSINITVAVENHGDFSETFNVTAYANTVALQTLNITNLPPENTTILTFTFSTSRFALGIYIISANASVVPSETDTADNSYVNGIVRRTQWGDIMPPYGEINIMDILKVAIHFGCRIGDPCYDPNADVNCDGVIDIRDILRIAIFLGKTYPYP